MAAPDFEVITATRLGSRASSSLRSSSKYPLAASFRFSASKASARSPTPWSWTSSATSWYWPRGSYTLSLPAQSTSMPSSRPLPVSAVSPSTSSISPVNGLTRSSPCCTGSVERCEDLNQTTDKAASPSVSVK